MDKQCSVGFMFDSKCHQTTYSKTVGVEMLKDLLSETRAVLMWRTGLSIQNTNATVCFHHKYVFLNRYKLQQKVCCNPFSRHSSVRKGSLREVTLDAAKSLRRSGHCVVPGQKLCPQCRIHSAKPEDATELNIDVVEPVNTDKSYFEDEVQLNSTRESLNGTLCNLEISPLKVHSVASHSKPTVGKRKLKQVGCAVAKKLATVLRVDLDDLDTEDAKSTIDSETKAKADDLDYLVHSMKKKVKVASRRQKLQILTLTPNSWSVRKASEVFSVSKNTIQKARLLRDKKGIAEYPEIVMRHKLSQKVKDSIMTFYCDDEFSRQLPGKKDYVSIGKNQHMSKRLILCNLKELYAAYILKHPENRIGFSKFANLRPKWCILVGPKGTHSVCVCTIHQNLKLMLSAIDLEKSYHELVEMIVCGRESKICMIHRCEKCPGTEPIKRFLYHHIRELYFPNSDNKGDGDDDDNEDIELEFKQWTTTDRTELISQNLSMEDFITSLCEKLDKITSHSFVARSQSQYLKHLKETIGYNEAIVLGDFAENYKFLVQDEIQGFHWNKSQCSLHPVVIYSRSDDVLVEASICILSDDLNHDVSFVYKVLHETLSYMKVRLNRDITMIHYFSDGCAGQYKNCKNFINLCYHKKDFSADCAWNFFATSHGKSPCDGIGGTVKRLTARASLQRPITNQILTAKEMFEFCMESIHGIKFVYVTTDEIGKVRKTLTNRFSLAKTVPGTRGYHQFVPASVSTIKAKRVSDDEVFDLEFDFIGNQNHICRVEAEDIRVSQYLLCKYDDHHWIGLVCEADPDKNDFKVKFMHPPYPSRSYRWPFRDDICWVPQAHVVSVVAAPNLSTVTGRQYHITPEEIQAINAIINCM